MKTELENLNEDIDLTEEHDREIKESKNTNNSEKVDK